MKVIYGTGIGTARFGQTLPTTNKLLILYGERGPSIGPSQTLVLDATVRDNVLVKKLTSEDIQTGFTNMHGVDKQIKIISNVTA